MLGREMQAKVFRLWDTGLCSSQIAERLGLKQKSVSQALHSYRDPADRRQRYDSAALGGPGRDGFAASAARRG